MYFCTSIECAVESMVCTTDFYHQDIKFNFRKYA